MRFPFIFHIPYKAQENESMKSAYICIVIFCVAFALPGCDSSRENAVITDGMTPDDFAKYEADLAAANSDGTYEDAGDAE